MPNIEALLPKKRYMHSFSVFGFVCTTFFSSHHHKTKTLIVIKNKVINLWLAKTKTKSTKVCLSHALLEVERLGKERNREME
jgi:hypothetical protein